MTSNIPTQIKIGIDATNIRLGGGITHLQEILTFAQPQLHQISEVVVWAGQSTLDRLPSFPWLIKKNPQALNQGLLSRIWWQWKSLSDEVKNEKCNLVFIPGGSYVGNFFPAVSMSQNLLPFEWKEIKRSGFSLLTAKMLLLRWTQAFTFCRSQGVIFLTQYSMSAVLKMTGPLKGDIAVIPHGFNGQFECAPRAQQSIDQYSKAKPYRILYVSNIDRYKHQDKVLEAIKILRNKNYPVEIVFIGPAIPRSLQALELEMGQVDKNGEWAHYLGQVPATELQAQYHQADLALFASSCETFGIILLEKMSAGLPIACSSLSSMGEVLQNTGLYFDPLDSADIAKVVESYLLSPQLRTEMQEKSYLRAKEYSWKVCAEHTFAFLSKVARENS